MVTLFELAAVAQFRVCCQNRVENMDYCNAAYHSNTTGLHLVFGFLTHMYYYWYYYLLLSHYFVTVFLSKFSSLEEHPIL